MKEKETIVDQVASAAGTDGVASAAGTDGTDGTDSETRVCPCDWPDVVPLMDEVHWGWAKDINATTSDPPPPAGGPGSEGYRLDLIPIEMPDGTRDAFRWLKLVWTGSEWQEWPGDEGQLNFEIHFRECPNWFITFGRDGYGQMPEPGGTPPGPNHCVMFYDQWMLIRVGEWEDHKIRLPTGELYQLRFARKYNNDGDCLHFVEPELV